MARELEWWKRNRKRSEHGRGYIERLMAVRHYRAGLGEHFELSSYAAPERNLRTRADLTCYVQAVLWQGATMAYNIFLHPLRRFPGPLLWRASRLPWAIRHALGQQAFDTQVSMPFCVLFLFRWGD